jgi:DNA-binding XRE family transcriptional regulator
MNTALSKQESEAEKLYNGELVQEVREEIGKTQIDLAYESRVAPRTLLLIERGGPVNTRNLAKVLNKLGLELRIVRKTA